MSENGFSPLTISLPINLPSNQLKQPDLNNNIFNSNNIENKINYLNNKCYNCKINIYNKRCKYRKRINNNINQLKESLLNFINYMNVEFEKQKCTFQLINEDINNYIKEEEEEEKHKKKDSNNYQCSNYNYNHHQINKEIFENGSCNQFLLELENEDLQEKLNIFKPLIDFIYQQVLEVSQSYNDLILNIQLTEYQSFSKKTSSSSNNKNNINNLFFFPFSLLFFKINNFLIFIKNRLLYYFNSLKYSLPTIRIQINYK
ncbi:hypothetical protein ACTFIV_002664 [Dictyostelium citrinum]